MYGEHSVRGGAGIAGFTLLEVLVALTIASLAIVVLFRAGGDGLTASDTAAQVDEAVERAKSHLDMLARAGSLVPGRQTGDDGGGFSWQTVATPVARQQAAAGAANPADNVRRADAVLYDVVVTVSWRRAGRTRAVALETRRLAASVDAR